MDTQDQQPNLFTPLTSTGIDRSAPLAFRMRPQTLDDILGQDHVLAPGKPIRKLIEADHVPPMILWGPPGTGKTTLANVLAKTTRKRFVAFSAVQGGLADLRKLIEDAKQARRRGEGTILFLDEIHRFNKAQQDALLPHVEDGTVTLIGATTENPSFEVNPALRSRCRIAVLNPLKAEHLIAILRNALADGDRGLGLGAEALDAATLDTLVEYSGGDARAALSNLEAAIGAGVSSPDAVRELMQKRTVPYDRSGDGHFDVVSALIKSIRGSDPDAALYWLARMIEGGEDPLFIARRLVISASEDVGNADPMGLVLANAAFQTVQQIGMPEARIPLAQATTYLASAPKSNAAYRAIGRALEEAQALEALPVPLALRNAPTRMMMNLGYGRGYDNAQDHPDGFAPGMNFWPDGMEPRRYYEPSDRGAEAAIKDRLKAFDRARREASER